MGPVGDGGGRYRYVQRGIHKPSGQRDGLALGPWAGSHGNPWRNHGNSQSPDVGHTNVHAHAYRYAYSHGDCDAYPHPNPNPHADSYPDPDIDPDTHYRRNADAGTGVGMIEGRFADKLFLTLSPRLIGGTAAPSLLEGEGVQRVRDSWAIHRVSTFTIGDDTVIEGYL